MKRSLFFVVILLYAIPVLAQDESGDLRMDGFTEGGHWYASPWVWVAAAALFILLLVFLTNKKND